VPYLVTQLAAPTGDATGCCHQLQQLVLPLVVLNHLS